MPAGCLIVLRFLARHRLVHGNVQFMYIKLSLRISMILAEPGTFEGKRLGRKRRYTPSLWAIHFNENPLSQRPTLSPSSGPLTLPYQRLVVKIPRSHNTGLVFLRRVCTGKIDLMQTGGGHVSNSSVKDTPAPRVPHFFRPSELPLLDHVPNKIAQPVAWRHPLLHSPTRRTRGPGKF